MTEFLDAAHAAGLKGEKGKQAIKAEYRGQVDSKRTATLTGSVDVDEHFQPAEPDANRCDYGEGVKTGDDEFAVWIEPHTASGSDKVAVMIKKLMIQKMEWLQAKLRTPDFKGLADLTKAAKAQGETPYRWLYKGSSILQSRGKAPKRLAQHGMRLPERRLQFA